MNVSLAGRVVKGNNYGRKLGFPTANIDRRQWRKKKNIRLGVYAGVVQLNNNRYYRSGIVVGPLDKTKLPRLEAHLLGFKGNLYGQRIALHLKKFLRPFRRYSNEAALKKQIQADIKKIKQLKLYE